jgi:hypothetical protein
MVGAPSVMVLSALLEADSTTCPNNRDEAEVVP